MSAAILLKPRDLDNLVDLMANSNPPVDGPNPDGSTYAEKRDALRAYYANLARQWKEMVSF